MAENEVELSADADSYFRTLPGTDYPQALANGFPRIANTIVELREDRTKLTQYFDSLLNDTRGGRQGFPFSVLMELQNLRDLMLGNVFGPDDSTRWV
jgi:hypothetical protein